MSEIKVGTKVTVNGKPQLGTATVKFYGTTQFQPGIWVGIELDTADGKNDGSVQSVRYFTCEPNHGLFIRENQVTVVSEETKETPPPKPAVKEVAEPPVKETKKETPGKKDAKEGAKKTPSKESTKTAIRVAKSSSGGKVSSSPIKKGSSNPGSASGSASTTPRKGSPTVADRKAAIVDKNSDSSSPTSPRDSTDDEVKESPRMIKEVPIPKDSPRENVNKEIPKEAPKESPKEIPKEIPKEAPKEPPKELSQITRAPLVESSSAENINQAMSSASSSSDLNASAQASPMRNESIDKLMRALKELNDFKVKAQETIRGLQARVREVTTQNEKTVKDSQKEKEALEKELEGLRKESTKEVSKIQNNWEREKENLQEQIAQLNDSLEMLTLDRELAEQKAEELEQQVEQMKAQIKIQEISQPKDLGSVIASDSTDYHSLVDQNEKLKEALMKLRDLSLAEKQEREKKIKELERENKNLPFLQEKVGKFEVELRKAQETIEELKEAVDTAGQAEDMIEELTEKNLSLEEKIHELESANEELEALRSVSEELEENQGVVEKQLRSEVYAKEIEILDQAGTITNLKNKMGDYERTIEQFRIVVRQQQDQLVLLKQREMEVLSQANELNSQSQNLMSITQQLQSKVLKTTAIKVDQELSKLTAGQASIQMAFVKDFIPSHMFQADFDCLSFLLFLKRCLHKTELIESNIQQYRLEPELNSEQPFGESELFFYSELRHTVLNINYQFQEFEHTFNTCDFDNYFKLGKLYYELNNSEKLLDAIITLMREEELTPSYPLDGIKDFFGKLQHLATIYVDRSNLPVHKLLHRETSNIMHISYSILLEDRRLITAVAKRCSAPLDTIHVISSIPRRAINHNIEMCRRLLKTFDEYTPQPADTANVTKKIEFVKQIIEKGALAFKTLVTDALTALNDHVTLEKETLSDMIVKIIQTKVDTEWKWMNEIVTGIYSSLNEVSEFMLRGYAVVKEQDLKASSPYAKRSSIVKTELSDSAAVRKNLEDRNKDIFEYKKQIQLKENDLQDAKFREQALEKKIQRYQKTEEKWNLQLGEEQAKYKQQEKMYDEALEALRKDTENLHLEIRVLKEKLADAQKQTTSVDTSKTGIPTELVNAEINSLRSALKFLRAENARIKGQQIVDHMSTILPPLASEKQNLSTNAPTTVVKAEDLASITSTFKDLQSKRAAIRVVDLSQSSTPINHQLALQKLEFQTIQKQVSTIRSKIPQPRVAVKQNPSTMVAKVKVPAEKNSRLSAVVNPLQMEQIHSIFVQ